MLYQVHQVHPDGTWEFIAQGGFDEGTMSKNFRAWIADVKSRHELPDGSRWWIVNEKSEKFVLAADANSSLP